MAHLQISFDTLDSVGGLSDRYGVKLLGPKPSKHFGPLSFGAVLGTLAIKLIAVEDRVQLARIKHRLVKRDERQVRTSQTRSKTR
jgi:hypothetical protein